MSVVIEGVNLKTLDFGSSVEDTEIDGFNPNTSYYFAVSMGDDITETPLSPVGS